MNGRNFDTLARMIATRRAAARALAGIAAGGALGLLALDAAEARCKRAGGRCKKGKRCCPGSTCKKRRCRCKRGKADCNGDGRCDTSVLADPNNCGACGNVCADDQRCEGGRCVCLDVEASCGETCCPAFQDCCGNVCRNLLGDETNCGACGNVCEVNERCFGGECRVVQI